MEELLRRVDFLLISWLGDILFASQAFRGITIFFFNCVRILSGEHLSCSLKAA